MESESLADVSRLVARLESGVADTQAKFKSNGRLIFGGSVVVSGIAAARGIWLLVPLCLLFGAAIVLLMRVALKRTGPERAAPVLLALREDPARIESIAHIVTSDSRQVFQTDWVVIETSDGRLSVRATDWPALVDQLSRHCPAAKVSGVD